MRKSHDPSGWEIAAALGQYAVYALAAIAMIVFLGIIFSGNAFRII